MLRSLYIAIFCSTALCCAASAQDIASMAQYEAAISSGKVVKMHPNLNMRFGHAKSGTLITFREKEENDYSSILIYGADHPGQMVIKKYKPDQAARYRVDAAFNFFVKDEACVVFIESEGVGVNTPEGTPDLSSHRALVFCQSGNQSKLNDDLTEKLDKHSGERGIRNARQAREILRDYFKR